MPQYFIKDGRHFAAYISSPEHVALGIRFTEQTVEPAMVMLPRIGDCHHGRLDEARIRTEVLEGLSIARAEQGVELYAQEIAWVENDTPSYELYRLAPRHIVHHLVSGGDFALADSGPSRESKSS